MINSSTYYPEVKCPVCNQVELTLELTNHNTFIKCSYCQKLVPLNLSSLFTEETLVPTDHIVNPDYYKGDDVMQIIERYELGFCLGNTIKYVLRSKDKSGVVDLRKALWYLEREISNQEKG